MKFHGYVIAYDFTSNRWRKKVTYLLADWGERVNWSVFECQLEKGQLSKLRKQIAKRINRKKDVVIYHPLCLDCRARIVLDGIPVDGPDRHFSGVSRVCPQGAVFLQKI